MEKKFNDYLPYYLGADFRYRYIDWEKGSWSVITKLNYRDCDKIANDLSIDKVELYLRPLSSMIKDEMVELWSKIFWYPYPSTHSIMVYNNKNPRWVMSAGVERLGIEHNGHVWADCDLSIYPHNQHEVTHYLLSKHFDLFGLCESGLAIEKK